MSGFTADIAIMSPVADTPVVAGSAYSSTSTPQFQAQLKMGQGGFKGWVGAKTQRFNSVTAGTPDLSMRGFEAGASLDAGAAGLLVNVQSGKGLGVLSDADQGEVRSTHYLAQATYKATDRLKLGVSYGKSRNKDETPGTGGLRSNENLTVGAYYALNSVITLVAEAGQTRSEAFVGQTARMNGVSLGGIIFF